MKTRKKKLILIQLTIFFVASLLLYNTYKDEPIVEEQVVEIQTIRIIPLKYQFPRVRNLPSRVNCERSA